MDFNFTKPTDKTTIRLKNRQNIIYNNKLTLEALLIFIDSEPTIEVATFVPIPASVLNTATTTSKVMTGSAEAIASGGAALGVAGIFLQIPIASLLLKFIMIFKILNRLRLININSGGVLGVFLANIYNVFEYGQAGGGSGQELKSKSRDKLDRYNIYVTPFIDVPHLYYFYTVKIYYYHFVLLIFSNSSDWYWK